MSAVDRVYVAFTPYHLLLALALQDRDGNPDATVLFADEARILWHAPEIGNAARSVVDLQMAPTLEVHPAREYPVRCRLAARAAVRFVSRTDPAEIYIFNGLRPESQRLFRTFAGTTAFKFVEDGFDSYVGVNRIDVARWHRAAHRLLCGSVRARSHDMIAAFPYESFHVVSPDLCRAPPDLVEAIPVANLRRATRLMQTGLSLPTPTRTITDLYLLANSERMADPMRYLDSMRAWVEERTAADPTTYIAVKAHPREKNPRLMDAVEALGDYMVPHWVPAELLIDLLSDRVSVHCGLTTFIVSSRRLLPERRLYLDQTVSPEHADVLRRWDPAIGLEGGESAGEPVDGAIGGHP